MLSFLRTSIPRTQGNAHKTKIYYEDGRAWNEFNRDGYLTTQSHPPADGTYSFFPPPPHRHMKQIEYFEVVSGSGRWYLSGTSSVHSAGDKITIPRWAPHWFVNAKSDEPLVIAAKLAPEESDREEMFFRNVLGYSDDCRKAGVKASVFQLQLFMDSVDSPIAICPGPEFIAWWVDWVLMVAMGRVVGKWLLGYRASYVEYYSPKDQ